jgi:hypothetical protein
MQEDDDYLDFSTLRDYSGGPEVNQYQVHLDECAIKGKKVFELQDGDTITLYTKEQFKIDVETTEDADLKAFSERFKSDFVLVGDEYAEGISDPDELEDALNSWGIY